jgi:hypothetical protein
VKTVCAFLAMVSLVGCGSAAEIAAALRETPVPAGTVQPGQVLSATPVPAATVVPQAAKNMADDYRKISEGMKREEIITILGPFHEREVNTFCDKGECQDYEYLSWLYKTGKIGVTIKGGVAVFTYAM